MSKLGKLEQAFQRTEEPILGVQSSPSWCNDWADTLAPTRPPPFKAIPSFALEWETDDKQVVGNQQNGGRTHMQCKMEWVKSQNPTFLNFFVAPALSY